MNVPAVVLELAAATVLLLYAVSLVKRGVEAASGDLAARTVGGGSDRRRAAFYGCLVAIALQSSTAVALLAAGFAISGALALDAGLAVLLGADLGSALVVKILSFDLHWLAPLLIAAGGLLHLKAHSRKAIEAGRAVLGIGLLLLSLQMIGHATQPLAKSPLLPSAIAFLGKDGLTVMILAGLFTWALHSSVAAILLILTFAAKGLVSPDIEIPLVNHLERLKQGVAASIQSSDMHLEIVRALKEVNSLVTTMAYPRLRETGDLLESRLVPTA